MAFSVSGSGDAKISASMIAFSSAEATSDARRFSLRPSRPLPAVLP